MKKTILSTVVTVVLCVGQTPIVHAETPSVPQPANIIIAEIQTGGSSDATEEFVELYNPNDNTIDMSGWQLQYRPTSGTALQTWAASTTKATIGCAVSGAGSCTTTIAPHGRVVLTHTIANIAGALPMNGGFSGTGGQIRLIQPSGTNPVIVHDFVGYGTALDSETHPAPVPSSGKSIKRKILEDATVIDTNNNAHDFIADCGAPSPGIDDTTFLPLTTGCFEQTTTPPPANEPPPDPIEDEEPEPDPAPTYPPLVITELFPDPVSPQQDSTDEFIEIYNPNDTAITLMGYRLQTGNDYRYSYTLGDTPLGPHMYLAIPSAVSKLSLVNSGSGVRLLDPNDSVVYEVVNYGASKAGQAWIQDETGWHWSLSPTPGAANILTLASVKLADTAAPVKKKTTASSTKTAAAPKVTTPKVPAAAKKVTTPSSPAAQTATAQNPQYWLLIPIGVIAGGYVIYEYRQDIARLFRRILRMPRKNLQTEQTTET